MACMGLVPVFFFSFNTMGVAQVICHMPHVICHMSYATFNLSQTPTATDLPLLTPPKLLWTRNIVKIVVIFKPMMQFWCPYRLGILKIIHTMSRWKFRTWATLGLFYMCNSGVPTHTKSLSQYHWYCQYRESMSMPWVHFYTMRPCLNHTKYQIERIFFRNTNIRNTEIQFREIPKYKLQKY